MVEREARRGTTEHVDEGTVHAWLDDQLGPAEGARIAAHVAACAACAALVADARGFIAASTRILTALDDAPPRGASAGVAANQSDAPLTARPASGLAPRAAAPAAGRRRARPPWRIAPWELRAAAAAVVVAVGVTLVLRGGRPDASRRADQLTAAPSPASATSPAPTAPAARYALPAPARPPRPPRPARPAAPAMAAPPAALRPASACVDRVVTVPAATSTLLTADVATKSAAAALASTAPLSDGADAAKKEDAVGVREGPQMQAEVRGRADTRRPAPSTSEVSAPTSGAVRLTMRASGDSLFPGLGLAAAGDTSVVLRGSWRPLGHDSAILSLPSPRGRVEAAVRCGSRP